MACASCKKCGYADNASVCSKCGGTMIHDEDYENSEGEIKVMPDGNWKLKRKEEEASKPMSQAALQAAIVQIGIQLKSNDAKSSRSMRTRNTGRPKQEKKEEA